MRYDKKKEKNEGIWEMNEEQREREMTLGDKT